MAWYSVKAQEQLYLYLYLHLYVYIFASIFKAIQQLGNAFDGAHNTYFYTSYFLEVSFMVMF
jgi:hypothetical protein